MPITERARQQIEEVVKGNDVVLFMKGSRHFPQCGFSAQVVQILNGHLNKYQTVNVLSDPEIRDGIKDFSSWPTIPQLYVKGQFVGGCDIIKELQANGELTKLLVDAKDAKNGAANGDAAAAGASAGAHANANAAPKVTMTPEAIEAISKALAEDQKGHEGHSHEPSVLRLDVDPAFAVDLYFGDKAKDDFEIDLGSIKMYIDPASAPRANGIAIAYVSTLDGGAFRIDNPNEPARVKSVSVDEVKKLLDSKATFTFFDVRPENERNQAKLAQALPLDDAAYGKLESMDRKAMIVFHCHHGGRSRAAAEHFLREGFTNVYNMEGGIDAWSQQIDTSIPRY